MYVCAAHAVEALAAIELVRLTAYRCTAPMSYDRTCGYSYWFPTRGDQ